MSIRIINCPKVEKSFGVSSTINPVTQVAEVAVKRALMKPILFPTLEATGRLRSMAPIIITIRNPNNNTCGGESFFSLIVLMSDMIIISPFALPRLADGFELKGLPYSLLKLEVMRVTPKAWFPRSFF